MLTDNVNFIIAGDRETFLKYKYSPWKSSMQDARYKITGEMFCYTLPDWTENTSMLTKLYNLKI